MYFTWTYMFFLRSCDIIWYVVTVHFYMYISFTPLLNKLHVSSVLFRSIHRVWTKPGTNYSSFVYTWTSSSSPFPKLYLPCWLYFVSIPSVPYNTCTTRQTKLTLVERNHENHTQNTLFPPTRSSRFRTFPLTLTKLS